MSQNTETEQSKTEHMVSTKTTVGIACSNSIWEAEIGGPAGAKRKERKKEKNLPVKSRKNFYTAEVSKV